MTSMINCFVFKIMITRLSTEHDTLTEVTK